MKRIRKRAARKAAPVELDQKIHEERLRIAKHLVQVLRAAGFSCELAEGDAITTSLATVTPQ
jgi:hypothetical protein